MVVGEGDGPHSSAPAWRIPGTEEPWTEATGLRTEKVMDGEPGGLQTMGSLRVGNDWATSLSLFTFMRWRRKWWPTPVFLPGESQGREPGGLPSMGSHRVGHDWCDLAAVANPRREARHSTHFTDGKINSFREIRRLNHTATKPQRLDPRPPDSWCTCPPLLYTCYFSFSAYLAFNKRANSWFWPIHIKDD